MSDNVKSASVAAGAVVPVAVHQSVLQELEAAYIKIETLYEAHTVGFVGLGCLIVGFIAGLIL